MDKLNHFAAGDRRGAVSGLRYFGCVKDGDLWDTALGKPGRSVARLTRCDSKKPELAAVCPQPLCVTHGWGGGPRERGEPASRVMTGLWDTAFTNQTAGDPPHVSTRSQTIQNCATLCADTGFNYAGVEWHTYCYCSVDSDAFKLTDDDAECNAACGGDRSVCSSSERGVPVLHGSKCS